MEWLVERTVAGSVLGPWCGRLGVGKSVQERIVGSVCEKLMDCVYFERRNDESADIGGEDGF